MFKWPYMRLIELFLYKNFVSKSLISVFQFDNVHHDCDNCYGNKNTDQADLSISWCRSHGVDLTNVDIDACLNSLRLGHLGKNKNPLYTEDDLTPCDSWSQIL